MAYTSGDESPDVVIVNMESSPQKLKGKKDSAPKEESK